MSNSGYEACNVTASGVRKDGVVTVVDILRSNPGLDGFSVAWLHAGGSIQNGRLVGQCKALSVDRFAVVLSMQKRIKDAELQGKIESCPSVVVRTRLKEGATIPIKAQGYKLKGTSNPKTKYYASLSTSTSVPKPIPVPKPVSADVASQNVRQLMGLLGD
jgi:hypothetical protein